MKMNNNKGIAKLIRDITENQAEAYYNSVNFEIVIYWLNATKDQINKLQLQVSKYIGDNMLIDSFKSVKVYN